MWFLYPIIYIIQSYIFSNLFLTKEMFSKLTWVFRIFDYHYMYWIELLFHSYNHHTRTNRTFIKSVLIFLYEGINKWFKEYYYYHFSIRWTMKVDPMKYTCVLSYLNRCFFLVLSTNRLQNDKLHLNVKYYIIFFFICHQERKILKFLTSQRIIEFMNRIWFII